MFERFGEYMLRQSVSVWINPELIVGEAGRRSSFSAKILARFALRQCYHVDVSKI